MTRTTATTDMPGLDGLSPAEVQQRIDRGEVNDIPHGTSRTVGEIVRANDRKQHEDQEPQRVSGNRRPERPRSARCRCRREGASSTSPTEKCVLVDT